MNMKQFASDIVALAKVNGSVRILPISQKDKAAGCLIHFAMGAGTIAVDSASTTA